MTDIIHPLYTTIEPPGRFTFPFCYEPHKLCITAVREVQDYISANDIKAFADEGKMFGVLVVEQEERLYYLAAYSGLLGGRNDLPFFVPPVFDAQHPDGTFKRREAEITAVNKRVTELENNEKRLSLLAKLADIKDKATAETDGFRHKMRQAKAERDALRNACPDGLTQEEEGRLIRESQYLKAEMRRIELRHAAATAETEKALAVFDNEIAALRERRRRMSDELQAWLFSQFKMLNARGECRDLTDIFKETAGRVPPAGAGECCAPKLLQYAYAHGLHPVCMAEFWWGASPKSEVRHHGRYYPSCRGKCLPILTHMLQGLDVDDDPQAADNHETADIIYEDGHIAVICKPAGMLSVPGKTNRQSVLDMMRERCPDATGPMIVHRLDMATSGLLVIAKTEAAYRNLQKQFLARSVKKTYAALVDAELTGSGRISLPLRPDTLNRPMQIVDKTKGRQAITTWRAVATKDGTTLLELHPETGRTHQLRVHCAHHDGLNAPITGDELYGHKAGRLFLHACRLEFTHPATGKRMIFERKAAFQHL